MNNKDNQLLFESYQLILERKHWVNTLFSNGYSQEQIDHLLQTEGWGGIKKAARRYIPAALGAAMTFNNAFAANTQKEDPLSYAQDEPEMTQTTQSTSAGEASPYLDKLYAFITNGGKTPVRLTKEDLVRAAYSSDRAEVYLKSMTPKQKQTAVNLYSIKGSEAKIPEENAIRKNTLAVYNPQTKSVFVFSKALKSSKQELIDTIVHEVQHASDSAQYPTSGKDWDNKQQGFFDVGPLARNVPVAKLDSTSSFNGKIQGTTGAKGGGDFISPTETRARVASARRWLGPITSAEQFKQKWEEAQNEFEYSNGGQPFQKDYLNRENPNLKVPVNFRQLIWIYNREMASKAEQQKLYNYILRTALDNSVAKADTLTAKYIS